MERYFVAALVCLSIVTPLLMIAAGDRLGATREHSLPFLDNARSLALSRDPVKQARVEMYLQEARDLLDVSGQQVRACRLLQQARAAGSVEAKTLHRTHCRD